MASSWREVRAALIGLVIVVSSLQALPGTPLDRRALHTAEATRELDGWMMLLEPLGLRRDIFVEILLATSHVLTGTRRWARDLADPVTRWTGTGQGWGFFATPSPEVRAIEVEGYTSTGSTVLFLPGDPHADFLAQTLTWRKMRGVWHDPYERGTVPYSRLAVWTGRKALEQYPQLDRVEVRIVQRVTREPGGPERAEHKVLRSRTVKRRAP